MSLKDYLLAYLKENGKLSYSTLEYISKGNNPRGRYYKVDTIRRVIDYLIKDGQPIKPIVKVNYNDAWVYVGISTADQDKNPTQVNFEPNNPTPRQRPTVEELRQRIEQQKKDAFLNK